MVEEQRLQSRFYRSGFMILGISMVFCLLGYAFNGAMVFTQAGDDKPIWAIYMSLCYGLQILLMVIAAGCWSKSGAYRIYLGLFFIALFMLDTMVELFADYPIVAMGCFAIGSSFVVSYLVPVGQAIGHPILKSACAVAFFLWIIMMGVDLFQECFRQWGDSDSFFVSPAFCGSTLIIDVVICSILCTTTFFIWHTLKKRSASKGLANA